MPKKEINKVAYKCCQCDETLSTQFYKTYSNIYSTTGYLPLCKKCISELFDFYVDKYNDKRKAMKRICMAFDLYFSDSLFDTCNKGEDFILGNYFKRLNMVQFKGKTFDKSIDDGFLFDSSSIIKENLEIADKETDLEKEDNDDNNDEISQEDKDKWGFGLDNPDYEILNSHYRFLKTANPNCDSNQEIFINDLCYTKMQQMKAVREGRVDDYNKLTESYRKSFTQAGLKTVRDSAINEEFTIGVNAETIEKYTPAEYYKGKELYKDFDNIGEYIERFLLRPLKNLMHGTKERDYEFNVKDEDDSNEYSEEE